MKMKWKRKKISSKKIFEFLFHFFISQNFSLIKSENIFERKIFQKISNFFSNTYQFTEEFLQNLWKNLEWDDLLR